MLNRRWRTSEKDLQDFLERRQSAESFLRGCRASLTMRDPADSDPPQGLYAILVAMDLCFRAKLIVPGLALLFSAIDVVSGSESRPSRSVFSAWTEKYMIKPSSLPCSGIDLYAARCGILHRFSAESDLAHNRKARQIFYAWGSSTAAELQRSITAINRDAIALHVQDLKLAFLEGLNRYGQDLEADPVRNARAGLSARQWFVNMKPEIVRDYLEVIDADAT